MAIGQVVLAQSGEDPLVRAAEARLEARDRARHAAHAAQLRDVLLLDRLYRDRGEALASTACLALVLRTSETRAGWLLDQALFLGGLPGGFEAMEQALLPVEAVLPVQELLEPLALPVRLRVWERLLVRLRADVDGGVVRPPARLREWLRKAVVAADPEGARRRREEAQQARAVECSRRRDGLVDLHLLGLPGLAAQAVLTRIQAYAQPYGPQDDRTADQRRADAAVDLLLGRVGRPRCEGNGAAPGAGGCGCGEGSPVACGADVQLLVPVGAARGTTDEIAEQVGHGPLEPDLLERALLSAPRITPVWVDDAGVPVALGRPLQPPPRGDGAALDALLESLAAMPPPPQQTARAPGDHRGPPSGHPPGPYRVPAALRRLLTVRRPRCEWPGCGASSARCDLDHDEAWPAGPTCGCNLGALCRRHHRIKQLGWTKLRTRDAVLWTAPTGRTWSSPSPYAAPEAPVRPPLRRRPDPLDELPPVAKEEELRLLDPGSPAWDAVDRPGPTPVDPLTLPPGDTFGDLLRSADGAWTVELRDPWAWDTDLLRAEAARAATGA